MLIDTAIIRYIPDILFQINPATHLFHDHTIDDIYTPFSHQLKGILPLSSGYMIGKVSPCSADPVSVREIWFIKDLLNAPLA